MKSIDIIIPCYNEESNVAHLYEEVKKIEKKIKLSTKVSFHFIFIDDGSTDETLSNIKKLSKKYKDISYISFSRNFGKEAAICAGLEKSKSEYTVIMDIDMQDPPSLLPDMIKSVVKDGYNACGTYRSTRRGEPIIRSFFANTFYFLIGKISKIHIPNGCRDYCIMDKVYREKILLHHEKNRFFKGIFCSIGYNVKWIGFENQNRFSGSSKWSFFKLFAYSIEAIMSFSDVPLILSSVVGLIFCGISFLAMMFIVIRAMLFGDRVAGWPSMITILLFLFGLMYLFIGMIGLYISKNYTEIKDRPLYIIKDEK